MTRLKIAVAVLALTCLAATRTTAPKVYKRAAPPAKWDKFAAATFAADAFAGLDGERPDFTAPRKEVGAKPADTNKEMAEDAPKGDGDFDRRDMMKRLQQAEESLAGVLSDPKTFQAGVGKVDQAADLFTMMGKTLFHSDPDYSSDDDYLKFAEDMANYGKQIKILAKKADYEGAGSAFAKVKKSCDSCHEGFR